MMDALLRAGHEVKTQGPSMGNVVWGQTLDERYIWTPNPPSKKWKPDIVVHMDGNWAPAEREYDCPHIVYGVDNHVRDYATFPNGAERSDWDYVFYAHRMGWHVNERAESWLPCAYDPQVFVPGPPLDERPHAAALIGVQYPARAELLYALYEAIPGVPILHGVGSVYDQYRDTYHSAKVSLVRSAAGDVAQRVFETAAMGCVVLMDACNDTDDLGLIHGENCLIYQNNREAAQLLQFALADPEEAQRIANAGVAWAKPHTWDARAAFIVDWYQHEYAPEQAQEVDSTDGD